MRIGMLLTVTEPETVFNALRLANYALAQGDAVRIFLMGLGVDLDQVADPRFNVQEQAQGFLDRGGQIQACGTCLKLRGSDGSELCPLSTMKDCYDVVRDSDKVLVF